MTAHAPISFSGGTDSDDQRRNEEQEPDPERLLRLIGETMREIVIAFLVEHSSTILTALSVSVIPLGYWIHVKIRGGILDDAVKNDDEREKRSVDRFGDVEVRLVRLEDGQDHIVEDVGELKRDTKEVRLELSRHGEQLAAIHANVEFIRAALNGARRPKDE